MLISRAWRSVIPALQHLLIFLLQILMLWLSCLIPAFVSICVLCMCLVYWSTLKIENDLQYLLLHLLVHYLCIILIVSFTWLAYFMSHDYFSSINALCFDLFCFSLMNALPTLEMLDFTIRIGSTPTFFYFYLFVFYNLPYSFTFDWFIAFSLL